MNKFDSNLIIEENSRDYGQRLKQELFSKVSNSELLRYYIPGDGLKYKVLCPFHKEKTPSFNVNLQLGIAKCFGCGTSVDGLGYIQKKYNYTFLEALRVAMNDFGIYTFNKHKVSLEAVGIPLNKFKGISTTIRIKSRPWSVYDTKYWIQFNVSRELCEKYNIYPISHYWINEHIFSVKPGELAYALNEGTKFQIYQPYANKDKKWFSNTGSMIYGYDQLPPFGKLLIITSSKKDILTLTSLGYNAVSPNNEGSRLPDDKYEDLNNRFDKIVVFFNNDQQGLKSGHIMSEELGVEFVFIPYEYNEKDPSDYCKIYGYEETDILIKKLLNE